jgi:hypothetical protein
MIGDRTTREAILAFEDIVHARARDSVHLHNKIERSQNTLLSVIKSFFGRHVAFDELAAEAAHMDTLWHDVLLQAASTDQLLRTHMSEREKNYFQLVCNYAAANATAAKLLAERQAEFSRASESAKRSTLTYAKSAEMTRQYEDAVTQCQDLFRQLKYESFIFLSPSNA